MAARIEGETSVRIPRASSNPSRARTGKSPSDKSNRISCSYLMNSHTPDILDQLIADHGPQRIERFVVLRPHLDLIRGLREKGGSFDTIVRVLRSKGARTSDTTLRRFCIEVLGEKPKKARGRRRAEERLATSSTVKPKEQPIPLPASVPARTSSSTSQPQTRGPRIARIVLAPPDPS
jgi:hypothetical protein